MHHTSCVKLGQIAHTVRHKPHGQKHPHVTRRILARFCHNCFAECKAAYLEAVPLNRTAF